jgi:2'-5' RNA ligase superfamily
VAVPDLSGPQESTILVPVPEAERLVGGPRARLDRSANRGVPAHVTVLYPFVAPDQITAAVMARAATAVASVSAFACQFASTDWFGDEVVWLAPEPASPFRALTAAVHAAFPRCPPFRGAFAEVIPHLTVGDRPDEGVAALRAAEDEVLRGLPICTHVSCAWLMTGSQAPGSWQLRATFPLGE